MSKILLVDTSFSSTPIFNELLKLGHEVHVAGINPQDCLAKKAEHYWKVNYSDIAALQALVDTQKFDFIVPGCNDKSYESCASLTGRALIGIDSLNTNQTINNKKLFKKWAARSNFPVAQEQDSNQNTLRWPLIVKPVDAFSGKGISIIQSPDEQALNAAISYAKQASSSQEYLIEDYVSGQLYSHSAFLHNHRILKDFFVREDCTVNSFAVDTSHVCYDFPENLRLQIRSCIESMSSDLNLCDGLIHTQFIRNADNFWMIEVTRRCPGDLYSQLIELSTGFRYALAYALPFVGEMTLPDDQLPNQHVMRHTVTVDTACNFDHLHFQHPVLLERWVALSLVGDSLKPSPASRIGIMFCKTYDQPTFRNLYETTLSRQLYDVIT